jgi:hypothetical protein
MEPQTAVETVKQRYDRLVTARAPFLLRARSSAALTIPSLMPPDGHDGSTVLPTPFQSLGARGVNNLSAKLLLALLPPNNPCFRYSINDDKVPELATQPELKTQIEEALGKMERRVKQDIDTSNIRTVTFEVLKQLIVSGNILAYLPPEGGMKSFRLDRYVVKRDQMGNMLETVVKEDVHPLGLTREVRTVCKVIASATTTEKNVSVYTHIRRSAVAKVYQITQEINGIEVPGSQGSYPLDKLPWLALRFTSIDNEDYGRGFIEEYFGDLRSLEGLSQAIVEGSAAAAKVLFLVNPNGVTTEKTVADSPNGAVKPGKRDDVTVLQMEKFNDFRVALETIKGITERLSFAFMLQSSVQRNGERVTAEEIRYLAGELEDSLGGVYSVLSQEFQLPLVRVIGHRLERQGKLPVLPAGVVEPTITTGLEALGRGYDLSRLDAFVKHMEPMSQPGADKYIHVDDYAKRVGTALSIDLAGLVKTADERAEDDRRAAQLSAMSAAAGPAVNAIGGIAKQAMANGAAPQAAP